MTDENNHTNELTQALAIQTASLYEAAAEGLALLIQLGQGDHIACKKLRAAINREPQG